MNDFNQNNNYGQTPYGYDGNSHNMPKKEPIWAAVTSFVLSLVSLVFCCCCCSYLTLIVSLVFGIISLVNKWRGTGFAVSGIVISAVTIILMVISQVMFGQMGRDMSEIMINSSKYVDEYRETGEIPDEFVKYNDPKYDMYWSIIGYDDFEDFFSDMIGIYENIDTYEDDSDSVLDDNDFWNDYDFYDDDGDFEDDDVLDDDDFWNDDDFFKDDDDFGEKPINL